MMAANPGRIAGDVDIPLQNDDRIQPGPAFQKMRDQLQSVFEEVAIPLSASATNDELLVGADHSTGTEKSPTQNQSKEALAG